MTLTPVILRGFKSVISVHIHHVSDQHTANQPRRRKKPGLRQVKQLVQSLGNSTYNQQGQDTSPDLSSVS